MSSKVIRKIRPPPQVVRFVERGPPFRASARKSDRPSKNVSDQAVKAPEEQQTRVNGAEYRKTMVEVQKIAAELVTSKEKKKFEKKLGPLPGSKPAKNLKMPYPELMHRRKLAKEREKKELESMDKETAVLLRKRAKRQSDKSNSSSGKPYGWWKSNLTSLNPSTSKRVIQKGRIEKKRR